MKVSKKKVAAGLAAGAITLTGAGVAYAYWSTTGSGEGSASTTAGASATDLTFDQSTINAMYPGDSEQDVTVTVTNTNANESVEVDNVKAYLTVDSSAGSCSSSDFLLNGTAAPGTEATAADLTWTAQELAAGDSDDATYTIQFNDLGSNQDGCKSASITVHYLVPAAS